ncbi:MAG: right-handed parallel beta-helix repeat-containing protein [Armatimonadia bacterium]
MARHRVGRFGVLIASALLLGVCTAVMAATYYVSPAGADTNLGTDAQPFGTINYAITRLAAGDVLKLNPGSYKERVQLEPLVNVANVRIEATTSRAAIIEGDGTEECAFDATLPIAGLQLTGLVIANSGDGDGLHLANAQNVTITDCEIKDSYRSLWIENGSNVALRKCYVHDNYKGYMLGWDAESLAGLSITDCVAANNSNNTNEYSDGFSIEGACSKVTISRCVSYGHGDTGFDVKPVGTVIDRCRAFNNWEAGFKLWRDSIQLSNSLSHHNGGYGVIAVGNKLKLWNLTLANNGYYGMQLESSSPASVSVRNCVFFLNPVWVKKPVMYSDSNNCYFVGGRGWMFYLGFDKQWRAVDMAGGVYPLAASSIVANPRFVSYSGGNYHLLSNSPCIRRGVWINNYMLYDLEGSKRVQPIDLGAYKYTPATP